MLLFRRCLKKNGVIVVKENVTSSGKTEVDKTDSSVTRPLRVLSQLFSKAGLKQLTSTKQRGFPKGLYPVHMFALLPQP
jgi:protein N-terminal methyltransferase